MPQAMPQKYLSRKEIERRYFNRRLLDMIEAGNHIKDGQPERSIHHFLAANEPQLALCIYQLCGGKEKTVRDMLLDLREKYVKYNGIDWIGIFYGEEYNLPRKRKVSTHSSRS